MTCLTVAPLAVATQCLYGSGVLTFVQQYDRLSKDLSFYNLSPKEKQPPHNFNSLRFSGILMLIT